MEYRYDLHVHTSEVSACGSIPAKEVVRLYHQAGYDGLVITDHYADYFFQKMPNLSWEDKLSRYLAGYEIAKDAAKNCGLSIFLGMELRLSGPVPNEYLIFGIDTEFLLRKKELYQMELPEVRGLVHDSGGLLFQAHPFRKGMQQHPGEVDGLEVFNGNQRHNSHNDLSYQLAKTKNLLMCSGSDFHELEDLAVGGIITKERITNSAQLVKALKNQEFTLIK